MMSYASAAPVTCPWASRPTTQESPRRCTERNLTVMSCLLVYHSTTLLVDRVYHNQLCLLWSVFSSLMQTCTHIYVQEKQIRRFFWLQLDRSQRWISHSGVRSEFCGRDCECDRPSTAASSRISTPAVGIWSIDGATCAHREVRCLRSRQGFERLDRDIQTKAPSGYPSRWEAISRTRIFSCATLLLPMMEQRTCVCTLFVRTLRLRSS